MDRGCAVAHLALAKLRSTVWFEYVESNSNWSDGASREGLKDPWTRENGFSVGVCEVPIWPWTADADRREALLGEAIKATLGRK